MYQFSLPDEVKIRRVDERLSALGNIIACNDHVAIVHAELSPETEKVCSFCHMFILFHSVQHSTVLLNSLTVLRRGFILLALVPHICL